MHCFILFLTFALAIPYSYQNTEPPPINATTDASAVQTLQEQYAQIDYCALKENAKCLKVFNEQLLGCEAVPGTGGCSNMQVKNITEKQISDILRHHNRLRSKIATRDREKFERATKMKIINWDKDLQYLAELQLSTCSMSTNKVCYVTPNGQKAFANIGRKDQDDDSDLNEVIDKWIDELSELGGVIAKNEYKFDGKYSSVAYMIHDDIDRIGCAMGITDFANSKQFVLNCIYNKYIPAYPKETPIYTHGDKECSACSVYGDEYKCITKGNFKGLCEFVPKVISENQLGGTPTVIPLTVMAMIEENFTFILIGGAVGICIVTVAASFIKMKFFM